MRDGRGGASQSISWRGVKEERGEKRWWGGGETETERQSAVVIRNLLDTSGSWPEERRVLQVDGIESKATTCWQEELGGSEGRGGGGPRQTSCLVLLLGDVQTSKAETSNN